MTTTTPDIDTFAALAEADDRTVAQRVHAVLRDLPAIGKNQQAPGSMGGFMFRGIEDITAALKPLLADHGVIMLPIVLERLDSVRQTAAQKSLWVVDLKIRFSFVGLDGDTLDAEVWGQGSDTADKATQKAITSAFKSMLTVVFCIADSEMDAERHDHGDTTAPPAPAPTSLVEGFSSVEEGKAETARVTELVTVAADLEPGIRDWVKEQGFPWPWPRAACEAIERKAREVFDAAGPACPSCDLPLAVPQPPSCENADHPI